MTRKTSIRPPDIPSRSFMLTTERLMLISAQRIYRAWTKEFDIWFAAPGTLMMEGEVNTPFFFETRFENQRHPHYGRFVRLRRNRLVEMTWVTGEGGTGGAETLLTVELAPREKGTMLRLTHAGFTSEESMKRHEAAWPTVLEQMEKRLSGSQRAKR